MVDGRKTLRFDGDTILGPLVDPIYKGLASPKGTDTFAAQVEIPFGEAEKAA
jgi:hypothetical protein